MFRLKKTAREVKAGEPANQEDQENCTPTLQLVKNALLPIDHALTIPQLQRAQKPAGGDDSITTPCFVPSTSALRNSKSEPTSKVLKNITNTLHRGKQPVRGNITISTLLSEIVETKEDEPSQKHPRAASSPASPLKKQQKKPKQDEGWKYPRDNIGALEILSDLKLEIVSDIKAELEGPLFLFRHLESNGRLDAGVLKLFSRCPEIDSIDMAPSYASHLNDVGLVQSSLLPARKCTVSLFGGFEHVKVLDLTNVHIFDDELRFIIKLGSLQALGLSGTKISNKGLKYLSIHAKFKANLQCLKLCYIEGVGVAGLDSISGKEGFKALYELDLWGIDALKLMDCQGLARSTSLQKLRLPQGLFNLVEERHSYYREIRKDHPGLILTCSGLESLSEGELKQQLKLHKRYFEDIFLNVSQELLLNRAMEIVRELEVQERLYKII